MAAANNGRPYSASPRARKRAGELGVSLTDVKGSAPDGAVLERDVVRYAANVRAGLAGAGAAAVPRMTPLAKAIVRVEGLPPERLAGSGTGFRGKVTAKDALHAVREAKGDPVPPQAVGQSPRTAGGEVRKPMTAMRRAIADKMARSWASVPHVTLTTEAEATRFIARRERLVERLAAEGGPRATLTDMLVQACAQALRLHPSLNVSLIDGDWYEFDDIHVGIAVAVDNGLVVPVVRDADRLSIREIASETKRLIAKARNGTLRADEMSGGRFTITNLGAYGIDAFTPIINVPEPAILGVGRVREQLLVENGTIRIGSTVALSLSFDHRVMDGAPAAALLKDIKRLIEQPPDDEAV